MIYMYRMSVVTIVVQSMNLKCNNPCALIDLTFDARETVVVSQVPVEFASLWIFVLKSFKFINPY